MSGCTEALTAVLDEVAKRSGWRCRPLRDGSTSLLTTDRVLVDSEPVHILTGLRRGVVVLSDGGETLGRLSDQGLDLADPTLAGLWNQALETYGVQASSGRVFLEAPVDRAASELVRFADALVALDGLRVAAVPLQGRRETLADEVEDFLRDRLSAAHIERSPVVKLGGGLVIRPTLKVETRNRSGILVQTSPATSTTQSFDHAYALFGLAHRGGIPYANRLVVLGGSYAVWNLARLKALSEVAYVGFWRYRERLEGFLEGDIPSEPLLAPHRPA
ncbi:DUF1828 domain-containing protein [Cellulomonas sp. NTE-D12]|uniref:DUF1828 domain-containing protein n=1 Tax=Cellulomonas sp. NTE-D12 TaxID=2962632 RepID=UPI003081789F|nr:hypothetical protein CELD12_26430 [Cellulomonas sp. NTE-D12]